MNYRRVIRDEGLMGALLAALWFFFDGDEEKLAPEYRLPQHKV